MKKKTLIMYCLVILTVLSKLGAANPTTIGLVALDTSLKYNGYRELGNNRGWFVDLCNRTAGTSLGSPYCMAFQYYTVNQAAKSLQRQNPLYRTASCFYQMYYSSIQGKCKVIKRTGTIWKPILLPGDILIFKHGPFEGNSDFEDYWKGHTAKVIKIIDGKAYTIEGNTNPSGSREGDGIYKKLRDINSYYFPVVAIIRMEK